VSYAVWLVGITLLFVTLERLFAWRPGQWLFRPGWLRDLGFLALNGHFFSLWTVALTVGVAGLAARALAGAGLELRPSPVGSWPLPGQFVALLVVADFLQWCVHNLLHRVPFLWAFHKVHHSIGTMDFVGNFHFHWVEILVYKTAQWLPLTLLGASGEAVLWVAVFGTIWGDLNHANLDVDPGPLGYVLNSPRMHLWHHDASDEGGVHKNFAVVLSLWDHLFGTAYWPRDRSPLRLGYPGDQEMPTGLLRQLAWPLVKARA
jgi:sterol desaturase/sphingolipid hydroxylase (fatty acid hydroxylase superfamily)